MRIIKSVKTLRRATLIFLAATLITTLVSSPFAAAYDKQFFSSNGINIYNPDATNCRSASDTTTGTVSVSSDNLETVLRYFTGKGFSLAAAAGIAGNLIAESGLNPAIIQGGAIAPDNYIPVNGVGFGIAQWTYTPRQKPLVDLAKQQGVPITNLNLQLDYVWQEMQASTFSSMITKLNNTKTDPVAAAVIFHGWTKKISTDPRIIAIDPPKPGYEASGDTASQVINNRGGNAKTAYEDFVGKIPDGTGVQGISTTGGTSTYVGCGSQTTSTIGNGKGGFTDSGSVVGVDNVLANAKLVDATFGTRLVWKGYCLSIVADTWNGRIMGGHFASPVDMWAKVGAQYGHKDKSPKVGAILIMRSSSVYGHVVIYLGNNKILNDGHIDNASIIETSSFTYLGWIDPNDIGWKSNLITDLHKSIRPLLWQVAGL